MKQVVDWTKSFISSQGADCVEVGVFEKD